MILAFDVSRFCGVLHNQNIHVHMFCIIYDCCYPCHSDLLLSIAGDEMIFSVMRFTES